MASQMSDAKVERTTIKTRVSSATEKFITNLEHALVRINNKTYGICRKTGKLISKARLKLVPHATLSIEAKKAEN